MPQDISSARFQPSVALNQDFGHSAVGRFGGRSVQQAPADAPRAGAARPAASTGVIARLKDLGSRLLDAVTPHGMRAQSKYRHGLEDTSRAIADLMGALSKSADDRIDARAAARVIDNLLSTMQPMTSRGARMEDVFRTRVEVNARAMTREQLVALKEGLQIAAGSELGGRASVRELAGFVQRELDQRLASAMPGGLAPAFQRAVAETVRESSAKGATQHGYDELLVAAGSLLRQHGASHSEVAAGALALAKDGLIRMLDTGEATVGQLRRVLSHISSKDMLALKQVPERDDAPLRGATELATILRDCIHDRADLAHSGFMQDARKILERPRGPVEDDRHGPMHDPVGFARTVIGAGEHFDTLAQHCAVHGAVVSVSDDAKGRLASVRERLADLLAPGNLQVQELSDEQLQKLNSALAKLGVPHGRKEVEAEMHKRKDDIRRSFAQALRQALTSARSNNVTDMLRGLRAMQAHTGEAMLRQQRLEGKPLVGADDIMAFRDDLVKGAMKDLPTADLEGISAALNSKHTAGLAEVMGEMAMDLMNDYPEQGKTLFNVAADLRLVDNLTDELLAERGAEPSPPPWFDGGARNLAERARIGLDEAFGVVIAPDGSPIVKAGAASSHVQESVAGNLESMRGPGREMVLPDGTATGVDYGLWNDMGRAEFKVRLEDGSTRAILDNAGLGRLSPDGQARARFAAIDQLKTLAGGDMDMVGRLSRYMNQNLAAGIEQALASEDSPIRLPDGSPGRLVGQSHLSFTAASDGNGGLLVRCDYVIDDCAHFMKMPDGEMLPLLPGQSNARFSFEVALREDGSAAVSDPVQFQYNLARDHWNKPYPRPASLEDVVASQDPAIRADFRAFAPFVTDSFDFLVALHEFSANPTADGARALGAQFIQRDAPSFVNMAATDTSKAVAALRSPTLGDLPAQALVDIFSKAKTEAVIMIGGKEPGSAFNRFCAANSKAD